MKNMQSGGRKLDMWGKNSDVKNMKLSVVIPCYNEEGNVRPLMEACVATFGSLSSFELIFVKLLAILTMKCKKTAAVKMLAKGVKDGWQGKLGATVKP